MRYREIFEKYDSDELLQYVKFHDELNPKLWDGMKLKSDVRSKLLKIVDRFIEFVDLPELNIEDIVFTGSNASFNFVNVKDGINEYTSDIDCHLIVNFNDITIETQLQDEETVLPKKDFMQNFFDSKRTYWNKLHNIKINGFPVEIYIESTENKVTANGIYSVENDEWLKEPKKEKPSVDDISLVSKTNQYIDEIDDLLDDEPDIDEVKKMLEKIYDMRKLGLQEGGEFSVENLTFKELRNIGYLDKMRDYILNKGDEEMSLDEAASYADTIIRKNKKS